MRATRKPLSNNKVFLLISISCLFALQSQAQLYVEGTSLFVQKNAIVKVETNLVTAKPAATPPKIRNWGVIAIEGNAQFHADTDYRGQGDLCLLGSSQQTLSTNGIPLKKIDIQNSNNVELGDDLTLQGEITLTSGYLLCNNHDLTIDDSVTINGGSSSSYIRINGTGKVKTTVGSSARTLPIGRNPYLPITLDDGGDKEYTVGVSDKVYANPVTETTEQTSNVVSETWTIQSSGSQNNVSITIQWDGAEEETGFARSMSYLSYWENGVSSAWDVGSSASASGSGPYSLTRTVNFSTNLFYFGVGSSGSALPVELSHFSVNWIEEGKSALLTWATSVEENNSHFEIQRALSGVEGSGAEMNWETIGQTQGQGTTFSPTQYTFTDHKIENRNSGFETVYYRLKQVDFSGQFEYSNIRTLHAQQKTGNFQIYPNPSNGPVVYLDKTDSYRILTTTGKELIPFSSSTSINVSNLQKGVYVIQNSEGTTQLYIRN